MKILSLATSLAQGGAETVLVNLVLGLGEHEHRVAHSTVARGFRPHRPFLQALARACVPCTDVSLDVLATAEGRHGMLDGFAPDVVLFHWWGRDALQPWLRQARAARRRPHFVCVLHHAGIPAPPGFDRYVVVSQSQVGQVPEASAAPVRLIPNGIDLARFSTPRRRSTPGASMVVGRLSRLSADKIPGDWVRTAAGWQLPRTRFVIAGSGPLLPALRRDVRTLGLGDRFALPGHVPPSRVPGLLASFDVFCHVTATAVECHPLALLEALAAGLPIVAEARGGIPEIVTPGVNGLLADAPEHVGDHLRALQRDPGLRRRLADGARRTASAFSLARQIDGYRRLLAEIERERGATGQAESGISVSSLVAPRAGGQSWPRHGSGSAPVSNAARIATRAGAFHSSSSDRVARLPSRSLR